MTKITKITACPPGQFCFIAGNQLYLYSPDDRSTTHLLDPEAMGDSAIMDLKISGNRISVLTDGHVYELTKTAREHWKSKSNFIYYPLEDQPLKFTELALLGEETYLKSDTGGVYKISSAGSLEPCTEVSNNKAIASSDMGVVILLETPSPPVNKMSQSIELPVSTDPMTRSTELDKNADLSSSNDSVLSSATQSTMEGSWESILVDPVKDHPSLYLIGPVASLYNPEKTTVFEIEIPLEIDFTPISVQVYESMIILQDDCGGYHYRLPQMQQFELLECSTFIGMKKGIMYCTENNKYVYLSSQTNERKELPAEKLPDLLKQYLQNQHQEEVLQEKQVLVEKIVISERLAEEIELSHFDKVDKKWSRILTKRLSEVMQEFNSDFHCLSAPEGCGKNELKKELTAEFKRIFLEPRFSHIEKLKAVEALFQKKLNDAIELFNKIKAGGSSKKIEYAEKLLNLIVNTKTKIDAFSREYGCERNYTTAIYEQEVDKFMHFYQVAIEQDLKEAMQAKGFTPLLGQIYLIQLDEFLAQQGPDSSRSSIVQQVRFTLWTSVEGAGKDKVLEATARLALTA